MPQKVRIALDAMGGDVGASVVIPGAAIFLTRYPDAEFLLFGDRAVIEAQLAHHAGLKKVARIIHTDVAVSMHDKPSQALRRGRWKSSMWLAIDAVKHGTAGAAVSAGKLSASRFTPHHLDLCKFAGNGHLRQAAAPRCAYDVRRKRNMETR